MTGLVSAAPASARGLHRAGVVAVEQIDTARKGLEIPGFDTIDKHEQRSAVGVLAVVCQPNRLGCGIAVTGRTVRQERGLLIGPQYRVEMLAPLRRTCPDQDPMTKRPCPLEQPRQGAFERRRQEMVKPDLGHACSGSRWPSQRGTRSGV